mmetsp:Transcript_5207/g.6553  ORF Transcript_5207/g.6553 Transcript_5207/m.6553 type:complete len:103 (+) Transcript_5207:389-697(+)|eukprot:CAMPEP_0204823006 /NCGR_PEP_ID=MMETSP1346-20131115/1183_1 /ASSEMBLY_ACC=CAM_ASM_000771 /TAXON_ID=215587 /ORGANISM="Aplanochytrium stocchinoi, Strain GSBS06" /LENGTH=102 /DNA_ID=CAMNT_0051949529 /DNA_START=174 /DNA_END=482 /DNA_ORIENTATION=+
MTPKAAEEALAEGMADAVLPVLASCDESVFAITQSQAMLLNRMNELQQILDKYTDNPEILPSFKPHTDKLKSTKERLAKLNQRLTTIQHRLDVVGKRLSSNN